MRPYDFAPLNRSTVGFDRLFHMLDSLGNTVDDGGYPPYNIEKAGDDTYRIVMAVAGFSGVTTTRLCDAMLPALVQAFSVSMADIEKSGASHDH